MTTKNVRRARLSKKNTRALVMAMTLMLSSGLVAGTSASFNASTSRTGTFGTAALTAPQALTATLSGTNVQLAWGAGSFGGGTGFGYRVQSHTMGVQADPRDGSAPASGTCDAGDTFTTNVGRTTSSTLSYSAVGAGSTAVAGSYVCFRVDTEYSATPGTAQWFSQSSNPVASLMVGHVVRSVMASSASPDGTINAGDSFTITFNQPVDITTGPVSTNNPTGTPTTGDDICVDANDGTIVIGRTTINTSCSIAQSAIVGRLSGSTMSPTKNLPSYGATYSWSDCPVMNQCRTLLATVGRRYRDTKDIAIVSTVAPSFEASSASGVLLSATGRSPICTSVNTSTSTCRPIPTGAL